jgi:hypothetical protein
LREIASGGIEGALKFINLRLLLLHDRLLIMHSGTRRHLALLRSLKLSPQPLVVILPSCELSLLG